MLPLDVCYFILGSELPYNYVFKYGFHFSWMFTKLLYYTIKYLLFSSKTTKTKDIELIVIDRRKTIENSLEEEYEFISKE